jgi:hypothetical protein
MGELSHLIHWQRPSLATEDFLLHCEQETMVIYRVTSHQNTFMEQKRCLVSQPVRNTSDEGVWDKRNTWT